MIKENQRLLNRLKVITDALVVLLALPLAFWIRFYLLPDGQISMDFRFYVYLAVALVPVHLITYASFGLYESFRHKRLYQELAKLLTANILDMALLQAFLFVVSEVHFSRGVQVIFFVLVSGVLGCKRIALRYALRHYREKGYNQKHVVIIGAGDMAKRYLDTIRSDKELGYSAIGYVSGSRDWKEIRRLGDYRELGIILDQYKPDEAVAAIPVEDFAMTPKIIAACEKSGTKLSLIPFYAEYMPSNPQFDDLDGLPLMNIRRIPLDNWANAFLKRAMDVAGSLVLMILTSPLMLFAAVGVKLSSPGPVIFSQERVGRGKKPFSMYKFRSMRVNPRQETGWSRDRDSRKTKFGAFIRKFSIDELPQFFNVFKGDMSLVGPRPEVPYYVEQFKEEIPLYMVKHQVRPGITGWAQVNGLRGDTSIKERIEHDIYYIEHWSPAFDVKILFLTLFKGVVNSEKLK